jgi:hypothetical protein
MVRKNSWVVIASLAPMLETMTIPQGPTIRGWSGRFSQIGPYAR